MFLFTSVKLELEGICISPQFSGSAYQMDNKTERLSLTLLLSHTLLYYPLLLNHILFIFQELLFKVYSFYFVLIFATSSKTSDLHRNHQLVD